MKALYPYELGNCLRGYKTGKYSTDEEAWEDLSKQFDLSFPSEGGRSVEMKKTVMIGITSNYKEPVPIPRGQRWVITNADGDVVQTAHVKYYVKEFLSENSGDYFVLDNETGINYTRKQFEYEFGE